MRLLPPRGMTGFAGVRRPALTLEQVFGALTFYLANHETVDQYLRKSGEEFERLRRQAQQRNPALYAKLTDARQRTRHPGA